MTRLLGELVAFMVVWTTMGVMGVQAMGLEHPSLVMLWGVLTYWVGSAAPKLTYNIMAYIKHRNSA